MSLTANCLVPSPSSSSSPISNDSICWPACQAESATWIGGVASIEPYGLPSRQAVKAASSDDRASPEVGVYRAWLAPQPAKTRHERQHGDKPDHDEIVIANS